MVDFHQEPIGQLPILERPGLERDFPIESVDFLNFSYDDIVLFEEGAHL